MAMTGVPVHCPLRRENDDMSQLKVKQKSVQDGDDWTIEAARNGKTRHQRIVVAQLIFDNKNKKRLKHALS